MRLLWLFVLAFDVWCHAAQKARPLQCGGTGKYKLLEMRNPASVPTECVYKIQPLNMNVCQIRVDFDAILQQPEIPKATEKGVPKCVSDTFTIAGLELCGNNQNQHVYIPVQMTRDNRRNTIDINIKIADRKKNPMLSFVMWNIRVVQLECARNTAAVITGRVLGDSFSPMKPMMARNIPIDVDLLAPHGCLQYHTGTEGTIETFNFNGGAGPYPPNLDYAICIRRRQGNSKIEFAFNSFNLSSVKAEAEGFDENCLVKATPNISSYAEPAAPPNEDYLMIPSATTSAKKLRVNKFCGNTINGQTATANAPGPYVLQFHSDNLFKAGDNKAREGGFNIKYNVQ